MIPEGLSGEEDEVTFTFLGADADYSWAAFHLCRADATGALSSQGTIVLTRDTTSSVLNEFWPTKIVYAAVISVSWWALCIT